MLGLAVELAQIGVSSTKWVVVNSYYGAKHMIYGTPKDPVLEKLEQLEKKIEESQSLEVGFKNNDAKEDNLLFYHKFKKEQPELIQPNTWYIISGQQIVHDTVHKSQALMCLAQLTDMGDDDALLIYTDNNKKEKIYDF